MPLSQCYLPARQLLNAAHGLSVTGLSHGPNRTTSGNFPLTRRYFGRNGSHVGKAEDYSHGFSRVVAIYEPRRSAVSAARELDDEWDTPTKTAHVPAGDGHASHGGQRPRPHTSGPAFATSYADRDPAHPRRNHRPRLAPRRTPLAAASHAGRFA